MCGSERIARMPSAPRLNVSHLREASSGRDAPRHSSAGAPSAPTQPSPAPANPPAEQGASATPPSAVLWQQVVEHVLKHTEDVGEQFADEARRIHYGESEQRGIRGSASAEDTAALLDEGIEVMPLPMTVARKGPLQ
jgi:hypothetical protein